MVLAEQLYWFVTWLNVGELLPEQKDCLLWRLMPTYNATDATYHDRAGVELDTNVDFGGVGGIAYLAPSLRASGYFSTMISFFEAMGYTAGVNLHGAPYDWRAAPDGHSAPGAYYEQLQRLVEATVERNGGAKAALVTHSLGGPTTLAFLLSRPAGWVASHISCFVPISAPWAGATRQALADISGDNFKFRSCRPTISSQCRPQRRAASPPAVVGCVQRSRHRERSRAKLLGG